MKQIALCELCGTCAVLFIILIKNLRLCSSAEAEIVLNLFLNFEQKLASCSSKIVLIKRKKCIQQT